MERFTAAVATIARTAASSGNGSQSKILILTGGPRTGKTFCTRTIVTLWKAMGKSIALASPTGRAAQRLSEMTGCEAKTIHRLLEFDPKTMKFKREVDNPIVPQASVNSWN